LLRLCFINVRGGIEDDGEISRRLLPQQFEMGFGIAATTAAGDMKLFQIRRQADNALRM